MPGIRATNPVAREVDPQRTPLSAKEVRSSIASAYQKMRGEAISEPMLDVLSAQACTETAHGASMYNFNFGGIKGASPEGATARLRTREVLDGREVTMRDGFRAYSSPIAGATDYLVLLERKFPRAFEAAKAGNVDGFVAGLKEGHYFTADAGKYAAALRGVVAGGFEGGSSAAPSTALAAAGASMAESRGFEGVPLQAYPTAMAVVRMIDAVNSLSNGIAAPSTNDA